ncbi:Bladder cancer-associated protein A [Blattella germanica]|nr:Bladder cancer-associated protein A [Blattella germanica]
MYCLQWLIPVLLIPKPVNPALLHTHVMFMVLYLIGFFLERKPCTICSLVFLAAVFLICYSGAGNCLLWSSNCDTDLFSSISNVPSGVESTLLQSDN